MAQDYIMRLLQQVAVMLAAVTGKRKLGLLEEASQEVEAACLRTIGLPLAKVKQLSPDELAQELQASGALRHIRAVMLAELLIQDAEMLEGRNEWRGALAGYIHAFCLLLHSIDALSRDEQEIYESKLAMLAAKLDPLPPNPYTTEKLNAYRKRRNARDPVDG